MKTSKSSRMPGGTGDDGEESGELKAREGTTELNNISGKTANDVGEEREIEIRTRAESVAAAAGGKADLAPPVLFDGGPAKPRKVVIDGEEVTVVVPPRAEGVSEDVQRFGPESRFPAGTPVRQDGTPCSDGENPYGIIGDVNTTHGKLVRRVIPLAALKASS